MQDFKDNFWNKRLKFILMIILIIIVISVPYFMDAFVYDNENIIKIGSINVDGKKRENCLFSEGLVPVCNNEYRWGYMDKKGNMVIDYKFYDAKSFSEGLAAVSISNDDLDGDNCYGYINKKGEYVIKPQFDDAGSFHEGKAYVGEVIGEGDNFGNKYALKYINKKGEVVIKGDFEYETLDIMQSDFSDGLACVCVDGKYGYIDKNGEMLIKPQYEAARGFSEGLALVFDEDKRSIINVVVDSLVKGENSSAKFINKKGETVIDMSKYYNATQFYNGVSFVFDGEKKYGFIDKKGNFTGFKYEMDGIIDDEMAETLDFDYKFDSYGYSLVYEDGKAEIINTKGEVIKKDFNIGKGRYNYSNGILIKNKQNGADVEVPFTDDGYAVLIRQSGMMFEYIIDKSGKKLFDNKETNEGNFGGICIWKD